MRFSKKVDIRDFIGVWSTGRDAEAVDQREAGPWTTTRPGGGEALKKLRSDGQELAGTSKLATANSLSEGCHANVRQLALISFTRKIPSTTAGALDKNLEFAVVGIAIRFRRRDGPGSLGPEGGGSGDQLGLYTPDPRGYTDYPSLDASS